MTRTGSQSVPAARGRASPAPGCGRECSLVRDLFTVHHLMMRCGDRLAGSIGLTSSRWLLICAIARGGGRRSVRELSEDALLSVQNTSRMLGSLERAGLIRRAAPPEGRAQSIRLTARGERVVDQTVDLAERFERSFLRDFTEPEIERMRSACARLTENLRVLESELGEEE